MGSCCCCWPSVCSAVKYEPGWRSHCSPKCGAMSFAAGGGHKGRSMIRERLAKTFDGDMMVAGDPGYDAARAVWNAMVDRRPRLIVRCRNVADVQAAVRVARDLYWGLRGGGGNFGVVTECE